MKRAFESITINSDDDCFEPIAKRNRINHWNSNWNSNWNSIFDECDNVIDCLIYLDNYSREHDENLDNLIKIHIENTSIDSTIPYIKNYIKPPNVVIYNTLTKLLYITRQLLLKEDKIKSVGLICKIILQNLYNFSSPECISFLKTTINKLNEKDMKKSINWTDKVSQILENYIRFENTSNKSINLINVFEI